MALSAKPSSVKSIPWPDKVKNVISQPNEDIAPRTANKNIILRGIGCLIFDENLESLTLISMLIVYGLLLC